jgi:hypothetical protein
VLFLGSLVLGLIALYAAQNRPDPVRRLHRAAVSAGVLTALAAGAAVVLGYGAALTGGLFGGGNPERDAEADRLDAMATQSGIVAILALVATVVLAVLARRHTERGASRDRQGGT